MNKNAFRILLGLGVVGLIAGSVGIWARLQIGHVPMAYGSYVPWGLWVAFDLIFLGLTAGAWIIVLLTYGFGRKQFERLGPVAVLTLLVSLLCEGIIISLDLGQPMRVYRFLVTPSFTSMLTWLVVCITAMWLIYLPMSHFLLKGKFAKAGADAEKDKIGPSAPSWPSSTSRSVSPSSPSRAPSSPSCRTGPSGAAPSRRFFSWRLHSCRAGPWSRPWPPSLTGTSVVYTPLARIVLALLVVFLLLEAVQFFIGYQSNSPGTAAALNMIAFGPVLVLGLLDRSPPHRQPRAPATPAVPTRRQSLRRRACLLIVITFLAVRYNAVVPDLAAYNLEGLDKYFVHPRLSQAYVPSLYEWLVSLWVVSLWVVVFLLGTKWLPVIPAEKGGEQHVA